MNYDSYLAHAIEIFNDRMDAGFSGDDIILTCFMTEDQKEIFEQFCSKYFPYRLNDRYQEEGYFDFRASSFIGMDNGGKDGILLRQVINVIDEIDFEEYEDRHAFGEIYETILRSLQSAGNSGEFYTPRAVTDFMVQMIKPKLGESIADFACGTGGFLTSALKVLDAQGNEIELKDDDEDTYQPGKFRDDDDDFYGYNAGGESDFAAAGYTLKEGSDEDDLVVDDAGDEDEDLMDDADDGDLD